MEKSKLGERKINLSTFPRCNDRTFLLKKHATNLFFLTC